MEFLFQLLVWALFGYLGYKIAEKLNMEHNMNFEPRIWAAVGFVFGLIGLGCLGVYAFFKIKKQ